MTLDPLWAREFVDLVVDERRLGEDLTAAGIAVEGIGGSGADTVFEMEIGTNRPGAMNHYGVAREAAAIYDLPLKELSAFSSQFSANPSGAKAQLSVKESNAALKRRSSTVPDGARKKTTAAKASSRSSSGTTAVVPFPITVEDPQLSPRVSARVLRGTKIKASPEKIAHRLQLVDERPIRKGFVAAD